MRSSEVSGVITSFPKKQAHSLECVRVSVSQLLPGAQECIAWGMPRIQKTTTVFFLAAVQYFLVWKTSWINTQYQKERCSLAKKKYFPRN